MDRLPTTRARSGCGKPPTAPDLPWGIYDRIYLLDRGRLKRMVRRPRDLTGQVHIASPQMALQYARLFTSPATVLHMADLRFEVVPLRVVDDAFYSGRTDWPEPLEPKSWLTHLKEDSPGNNNRRRYYAVLYDDEWERGELPGPEVMSTGQGFVVRRLISELSSGESVRTAWWSTETVGSDGAIRGRRIREITMHYGLRLCLPRWL